MSKNKEGYGTYDLTEDLFKRRYNLKNVDRNDKLFIAEARNVGRFIRRMNLTKNSPKKKFFVPVDQYKEFLDNFYILYSNSDCYKAYQDATLQNPKLTVENDKMLDTLVNTILESKEKQLCFKAKEKYKQFIKDLHSYTYHEEKVTVCSRIKEGIKADFNLVDDLLSEEDKLEFLQIYEEEISTLRANMMNICKLKIEEEKQLKVDREAFWLGNNADELNKIFNETEVKESSENKINE